MWRRLSWCTVFATCFTSVGTTRFSGSIPIRLASSTTSPTRGLIRWRRGSRRASQMRSQKLPAIQRSCSSLATPSRWAQRDVRLKCIFWFGFTISGVRAEVIFCTGSENPHRHGRWVPGHGHQRCRCLPGALDEGRRWKLPQTGLCGWPQTCKHSVDQGKTPRGVGRICKALPWKHLRLLALPFRQGFC